MELFEASLQEKLDAILGRFYELECILSKGGLSNEDLRNFSKEYSEVTELAQKIEELNIELKSFNDAKSLAGTEQLDDEMREMLKDEIQQIRVRINFLAEEIRILLIPVDKDDVKNAILEIRAGTGGDEASLFAHDLFNMYIGYATKMKWKYEVLQFNSTDLGGLKEVILSIQGKGVFGKLKFESGVHRIQRVPVTESSGRVHTSTATVAVLSEAEDVDVQIRDEDLRIDFFRSSGPGGQSVNTTDSAVRITHIPTGIVVSQQDEKSQHKNKAKALKILQARVYEYEKEKIDSERAENRRSQVGTGDRSERIRTYNFHDNRVTDHRINFTLHKLEQILSGEAIGEMIDELIARDRNIVRS